VNAALRIPQVDQALFLRGREQIRAVAREADGKDRVGEEFGVGVDAAVRDLSGGKREIV